MIRTIPPIHFIRYASKLIPGRHFYILLMIYFIFNAGAYAQMSLGLDAGFTYNKINKGSGSGHLTVSRKQGYMVNVLAKYKFNNWLTLEAAPGVIQKNYTISNVNHIYQDINNTYLQLPLSMQYQVNLVKNVKLSVAAGVYYAYWLKSTVSGVAPNVFELSSGSQGEELIRVEHIGYTYNFTKQDNRSEFGWLTKIGLEYKISNHFSGLINGQYYQGITGQQKQLQVSAPVRINKTVALTSGLRYHF